jgi:hypothetical protein
MQVGGKNSGVVRRRIITQNYKAVFDGSNDWIGFNDSPEMRSATTEMTVIFNGKLLNLGMVLEKLGANGSWQSYYFKAYDANNFFYYHDNYSQNKYIGWRIPATLTNNNRVVCRWVRTGNASTDLRVWLNGVEITPVVNNNLGYNSSFVIGHAASQLLVGAMESNINSTKSEFGAVELYDLALYGTALDVAVIQQYNTDGIVPSGAFLHIKPEKRTDNVVINSATNAQHGTANNVADYNTFYQNR